MTTLTKIEIGTGQGAKSVSVVCGDIRELDRPLDVMTVSAFIRNYRPTRRTMIGALSDKGISVQALSTDPAIDLRSYCNVWLSKEIPAAGLPIRRIGCIEMGDRFVARSKEEKNESSILSIFKAYFRLLDLAADTGVEIKTLGLLIPGTGNQRFSDALVLTPILNECIRFLKRNETVRSIVIIERDTDKAGKAAEKLNTSYSVMRNAVREKPADEPVKEKPLAFISYSHGDRNVADNLCAKLEFNGIRVWYAPRNVEGPYASAIVHAIERCSLFIVILSQNSLASEHVLNEVDLAFQRARQGIRFFPLKLDNEEMGPSFRYYLSRQHWMDATLPPLEKRLDEFVTKIKAETAGGA